MNEKKDDLCRDLQVSLELFINETNNFRCFGKFFQNDIEQIVFRTFDDFSREGFVW